MTGNLNKQLVWKRKTPYYSLISLTVVFFVVSCCFPGAVCWANSGEQVWHADTNTGIQKLIDEAFLSGGGTVFVKAGHYEEEGGSIFLREGVSLIGEPADFGSVEILGEPDKSVIWADSNTTIRNLIIHNGYYGIRCSRNDKKSKDITIAHNLIVGNEYGIYIRDSHNIGIINNTIVHNKKSGLFIFINPNSPTFHGNGNIIALNDPNCGIAFAQQDEPDSEPVNFLDLTAIPICLSYNDFYDVLKQRLYRSDGKIRNEIPISSLELFGPGNFSVDPYFVNPNKEDYRLLSYSPCIDKGEPNSNYSLEPLPNGGRINSGFYGNTPYAAAGKDTDDDGIKDFQEGNGDIDKDGVPDWQDRDTAIIPLPRGDEKIAIYLQDMSHDPNETLQFKDVQALFFSDLTIEPPEGIVPFEAIKFSVTDLDEGATVLAGMLLPEDYNALQISQYLCLSSDTSWQSLPFEIDPNKKAITFRLEDGQIEDRDGTKNGIIEHLACLVIPQSITLENPDSCFFSMVNPLNFLPSNQNNLNPGRKFPVKK